LARRLPHKNDEDSALYEREKRFVHHSGDAVWAKVLRVPVRDPAGQLRYHVGVLVDITERKRAEMALAASEQRYRLRFEHALDGMFLWDEAGRLADVNPAFCRMLGATRDELLGRPLSDVTPELEVFADATLAAVGQGGGKTETRLLRKCGVPIDVEMSVAATGGEGGRLFHTGAATSPTANARGGAARGTRLQHASRHREQRSSFWTCRPHPAAQRQVRAVSGYREEVRGRFLWEC
jgi:PAS domain S-box-containing protein